MATHEEFINAVAAIAASRVGDEGVAAGWPVSMLYVGLWLGGFRGVGQMSLSMYAYPGKFEGELALAPLAYAASLDGCGEEYDFGGEGSVDIYTVCTGPIEPTAEEIAEHDLTAEDIDFARNLLGFIVHEGDAGFVSVSWYAKGDEVAMAQAVGKLDSAMGEFEREQGDDDDDDD